MLGNPFNVAISASAVIEELQSVNDDVNTQIYVWDHDSNNGNGSWITLSGDDTIAPYQGFFVRFGETAVGASGTITFDKSDLEAGKDANIYKNVTESKFNFQLGLYGKDYFDTYKLVFSEEGAMGLDRFEAYKLFSLKPNSINLYSTLNKNRIYKNVLPAELNTTVEIPLLFEGGDRESLTFQWEDIKNLPTGWKVTLIDKELNRQVDLTSAGQYQFSRIGFDQQQQKSKEKTLLNKSDKSDNESPRFILAITPNKQRMKSDDLPDSIKLNPNYPNPFNPQTTIPYELAQEAEVKLTIWNMIGQKVATLVDGLVEKGTHEATWNASTMPSGIYIARFEVGDKVLTRKMTLIK